ncbi:MAG: phenylalanine--tRNA ligase subunit beta [Phycisphaeraceae bacterium]|nr:phenylalanine--tRNA ligase subunit beta [Phycisphaeraceae bacterium]
MKVSLNWLNRYLDRPVEAQEAAVALTRVGFPIEEHVGDMLDVEVTSNRGDCLSHLGVARELAAATGRTLKEPDYQVPGSHRNVASSVALEAPDLCPIYTARLITGVRVGPSPAWLVECLTAIGLRSVNNVVDVTNFVLMEIGEPLHAFDLDKLAEKRIVVRRANKGEAFTAIDNSKHTLGPDMLVIADAAKPVALAGVMGGLDSEVSSATTNILLEAAIFDPLNVRTTSRALKLASDSSYRFERGIDPRKVEQASARAAALIVELAGGQASTEMIVAGSVDTEPKRITLRPQRCIDLLGEDISAQEQMSYLEKLGLSPKFEDGLIACTAPTFRLDLLREVDLIEEVARSRGLDNVPQRPRLEFVVRPVQVRVAARRELDEVLVAHGYHETITPSMLEPAAAEAFADKSQLLSLDPQRRKVDPTLRPSVLPSLLACRKLNQDRGNAEVHLYEAAAVWTQDGERQVLALLGDEPDEALGLRRIKSALSELAERLGGELAYEPVEDARYAAAAKLMLNGKDEGRVGVLLPGAGGAVLAAEMSLEPLLATFPPQRRIDALPRFPGIERDLSMIVDEQVTWRQFEQIIREVKPAMLEDLKFLIVYRGKPIPKGRKSVSLRLRFRDPRKTLKHEEVDPQVAAVVDALKQKLGAELRT